MYELLNQGMQAASLLAQGWCLHRFLWEFLPARWPRWRSCGVLAAALYMALQLAAGWILPTEDGNIPVFGRLVLICCGLCLLAFCFYRARRPITAFLLAAFLAVSQISFFLAYTILQLGGNLFDLWVWMLERGMIATPQPYEMLLEGTALLLFFLLHAATVLILYFSLGRLAKDFREKDCAIHRTELSFLLTPALTCLLICVLLRKLMVTMEDGLPRVLYDRYPILVVLIPAILILSLLSIHYGVRLFQEMAERSRERSQSGILQRQVQGMQEQMAEMERVYSDLRSIRHDMNNTLAVIRQLAAGDCIENDPQLQEYLDELHRTVGRLEQRFQTGSPVADTLLSMKLHESWHSLPGLRFDADRLVFPPGLGIKGYDLGIILGNALDNALEACRRLREQQPQAEAFIRLSAFRRGMMFFLECENSFDGQLIRVKGAQFPATSKADGAVHGIGLANIQRTAGKYHGGVEWSAQNGVFTLSVMMQEEVKEEQEL